MTSLRQTFISEKMIYAAGVHAPYSPFFYSYLMLLHLSLVCFVWQMLLRQRGGLLNEVVVLLFLLVTAVTSLRRKKNK